MRRVSYVNDVRGLNDRSPCNCARLVVNRCLMVERGFYLGMIDQPNLEIKGSSNRDRAEQGRRWAQNDIVEINSLNEVKVALVRRQWRVKSNFIILIAAV